MYLFNEHLSVRNVLCLAVCFDCCKVACSVFDRMYSFTFSSSSLFRCTFLHHFCLHISFFIFPLTAGYPKSFAIAISRRFACKPSAFILTMESFFKHSSATFAHCVAIFFFFDKFMHNRIAAADES